MSSTINLTSQRISFVNKISVLQKALSDDETPTPSYLYKDINNISFESIGYCESLLEFLVDRLRHKSCHVKLKVLKVMKHVLEHGSTEFQLGLRHQVAFVKEHTKFSGPPHPIHGNTPYAMIRNLAMELCEQLYNMNPLALKAAVKSGEETQVPQSKYTGMGPSRTGGAIQGFGNSPVSQSKGIAGTILQEIEKLGTRLSETPADRQAAVLARLNLSASSSNYQPPVVSTEDQESFPAESREKESASPPPAPASDKPASHHLPGKAGGGWNDDSDDEDDNDQFDYKRDSEQYARDVNDASQSLHDMPGDVDPKDMESEEKKFVNDLLFGGVTSQSDQRIDFLSNSEIANFLQACSRLKCNVILDCLCQQLAKEDAQNSARSLQLLEGMVYSRQELVNIDLLALKCKAALVESFVRAGRKVSEGGQAEGSCPGKWRAVQTKAAKLILILQQLSSHKDILPSTRISNELSVSATLHDTEINQTQAVASS